MYYVGFCPVCGTGSLGIRLCAASEHTVVLCDECDALWLSTDCTTSAIYPSQPDLPCPECGASLREPPAHWASEQEVEAAGWMDAVVGQADAIGEPDSLAEDTESDNVG